MLKAKKGFTLIELMIVIAIIAIIAAIAIPGLLQSQRASNERSASASLKTLASAEADFRANDRDANKVNDFYTLSVNGLYTLTPWITSATGATTDTIRLIELSVAGADAEATATADAHSIAITALTTKSAKAGFWYQAMFSDASSGTLEAYKTNTDGSDGAGGAVGTVGYHTSKFGFIAWPDSMSSGRFVYALNEGNTIMRRALTMNVRPAGTVGANIRLTDTLYVNWPNDTTLKASWGKMD